MSARMKLPLALVAVAGTALLLLGFKPKQDQPDKDPNATLNARPLPAEPDPEDLFPGANPQPQAKQAPISGVPKQRGVALGLFAEDVSFSYRPLLQEIVELGATHVALVVPLYQQHGGSTRHFLHTRYSPTLETTADAIRTARRLGLEVTLFPIIRLLKPRAPDEWRGTLKPDNRNAWFASYGEHLGDLAALATFTGATRLVVGSELSTLDTDTEAWTKLLARVRGLFSGTLLYSANWDHYKDATLLDLVDEPGVTAYFNLRKKDGPSDVGSLIEKWRSLRDELEAWATARGQPFVFTEVGYRSRTGGAAEPWNEVPDDQANTQEQANAFEAFGSVWSHAPSLAGYYVWNWYGYGGPNTTSYTPRGKPAADIIRHMLTAP